MILVTLARLESGRLVAGAIDIWLERLGYATMAPRLHRAPVGIEHAYGAEIRGLFGPDIRAVAVFEVDGVPAVCFVEGDPREPDDFAALQARVWNQGLISVVMVVGDDALRVLPAIPDADAGPLLRLDQATLGSPYSALGIDSAALIKGHPEWFERGRRVDEHLIANLSKAVERLVGPAGGQLNAQHLMAQVLFISYLEHRGIVEGEFRQTYGVRPLHELVRARDGAELDRLIVVLGDVFNGDFLKPNGNTPWSKMSASGFDVFEEFLERTDLTSGQTSLWGYDFRYIPVELLSGIYESFIGEKKVDLGAFYTPRHLANLVVDEALAGLPADAKPCIFDGACGSGILLTTAFRRILHRHESRHGQLSLGERGKLLQETIFGGDLNEAACKVTAFSLYLSLLEDLVPSDISKLTAAAHDKLPTLSGENIFSGDAGDMFSASHPLETGAIEPTIFISNPPWGEPKGAKQRSFEAWLKREGRSVPLRQIAFAFAMRATSLAKQGARLALVMPASGYLKAQSQTFLTDWLDAVTLRRLINLGDMRMLLFKAKHACVIAVADVGSPRRGLHELPPWFDYVTPKADAALAYGRISIHRNDRKRLLQARVQSDPAVLRTLYWGSEYETGQLARLTGRGRFQDLVVAGRFKAGKGFHITDGDKSVSLSVFRNKAYLDAKRIPARGLLLPHGTLKPFDLKHIASHGDFELYKGPRVVFPDGMTRQRRIRACYSGQVFSFNNTTSAIRDTKNDRALMRFAAAYLCSDLAAYFAVLTAPTAVIERTQIKLAEVLGFPFWLPERHPEPARAQKIIDEVAEWVDAQQDNGKFMLSASNPGFPRAIERAIERYFLIDPVLSSIVSEQAEYVLEAVQPTSFQGFPTALQLPPTDDELEGYATTLTNELERLRAAAGGTGRLSGRVEAWRDGDVGYGVVYATAGRDVNAPSVQRVSHALLTTLKQLGLLDVRDGAMSSIPDVIVRAGDDLIFAKPLVRRQWLRSAALDDALAVVRAARPGLTA